MPERLNAQELRDLGTIVRGSLTEGLEMKLSGERSVEEVRAGRFVVIQGEKFRYFSMITDVSLQATNPQILANPPRQEDEFHRRILAGTGTYGLVKLRPMLMIPADAPDDYSEEHLLPVKTIPGHFSAVLEADAGDVAQVFGSAARDQFFEIGQPLEMDDTPVCLNLDRFVERSNAIFGKSGTGKTFLTRLCLCGIIKQRKAVNLVFDMHSEYGWKGQTEDRNRKDVRGLRQYFGAQVAVFTLDEGHSLRRGVRPDCVIRIPFSELTVEDVVLLERELNLSSTATETGYLLVNRFEKDWLKSLLDMDGASLKEFADESGAHPGALSALKRKMNRLREDCAGFLVERVADADNAVPRIMECLDRGTHVVIEFGQYYKPLQYMLVANILTRRIHREYVKKKEREIGGSGERRPLVITIEEAHKFLSPTLADQTIFGTIARELRKYDVTLLIVDQRPSGIDSEILSQVGTKLICLLDDERDVDAVLTGTPGASGLRSVLASLDTRQQALLLGHAVPMPIVVKTRTYDDPDFREAMGYVDEDLRPNRSEEDRKRDFPD